MTSFFNHVFAKTNKLLCKMAFFSDELFNVFEEESAPPNSKGKKRRREEKGKRSELPEKPKKPRLGDATTGTDAQKLKSEASGVNAPGGEGQAKAEDDVMEDQEIEKEDQ